MNYVLLDVIRVLSIKKNVFLALPVKLLGERGQLIAENAKVNVLYIKVYLENLSLWSLKN